MINFLAILASMNAIVNPFATDGCTGFFDGTTKEPTLWRECCVEHDLHYWAGGSRHSRSKADSLLRDCVKDKAGWVVANLMYGAVRAGHLSPKKIKGKEWGNAWTQPGFDRLTPAQVLELKGELPKLSIPRDVELRFIERIEKDSTEKVTCE